MKWTCNRCKKQKDMSIERDYIVILAGNNFHHYLNLCSECHSYIKQAIDIILKTE